MVSVVVAAMDQRLVMGMTYTYQIMQTHIFVEALSATLISFHQDNRERSSPATTISLLQIMRCLDSVSDNYQAGEINSSC